jgi:hypothetical protein
MHGRGGAMCAYRILVGNSSGKRVGSGSWLVAGFGVVGVEPVGSGTRELV